jgi:hypothetical protein
MGKVSSAPYFLAIEGLLDASLSPLGFPWNLGLPLALSLSFLSLEDMTRRQLINNVEK